MLHNEICLKNVGKIHDNSLYLQRYLPASASDNSRCTWKTGTMNERDRPKNIHLT